MHKRPALALLFSFLIPGLGQIYNDDLKKGGVLLTISLVSAIFFGPAYLVIWFYGVADAYFKARSINARVPAA